MKLEQRFVVAHPRAQVWRFFGQVDEVVTCMPGASLTAPYDGGPIKGKLVVKLGPMSADFAGEAELARDDEQFCGQIRGQGRDGKSGSRTKGEIRYTVSEADGEGATRVDVTVDFSLAGPLAQFSRGGIINDIASRLTETFAQNLEAKLAAIAPPHTAAADGTSAGAEATTGERDGTVAAANPVRSATGSQLDAGTLLSSVIWSQLKKFFSSIFRRG